MSGLPAMLAAQIGAELRTRLRSTGTLVAALGLLAAAFLWIPGPTGNTSSITWMDGGRPVSGAYSADFVGLTTAMLASTFLGLFGFYLVTGSIRRDRERGIGAILAATPLSKGAYLVATFAAHLAYLQVLGALALGAGVVVFLRYGTGALSLDRFLIPALLLTLPSFALTAALAVAFETLPFLRGRGGLVLYIFVWTFYISLPLIVSGDLARSTTRGFAFPDPVGVAAVADIVSSAIPSAEPGSISMGIQVHEHPIERVTWPGTHYGASLVASRASALLWTLPPLALALLFFDRFDPARTRVSARRDRRPSVAADAGSAPEPARAATSLGFERAAARPSFRAAVHAEAWLAWIAAGWLRWPLLGAALAAAVTPWGAVAFLILLAPALSEIAAREDLCGTRALVWAQPSVPRSRVLWKAAAAVVFVLVLGVPGLARAAWISPAQALAWISGLLFVAAFAVGAGSLSRGGKLFSCVYTALWYVCVNGKGVDAVDFCGVFGGGLSAGVRLAYLSLGAAALGLALAVENTRADG